MTITKTINTELIREDQIESVCTFGSRVIVWEILKYASDKGEPWTLRHGRLSLLNPPPPRNRPPSDFQSSEANCLRFSKQGDSYSEVAPFIHHEGDKSCQINPAYLKAPLGFYIWPRNNKTMKEFVSIEKKEDNKVEATYEFNTEDFDYELALVK